MRMPWMPAMSFLVGLLDLQLYRLFLVLTFAIAYREYLALVYGDSYMLRKS